MERENEKISAKSSFSLILTKETGKIWILYNVPYISWKPEWLQIMPHRAEQSSIQIFPKFLTHKMVEHNTMAIFLGTKFWHTGTDNQDMSIPFTQIHQLLTFCHICIWALSFSFNHWKITCKYHDTSSLNICTWIIFHNYYSTINTITLSNI